MDDPHVLDVLSVSVGYAGVAVCGDISVQVCAGDVLGVVGFNGAGKSTFARTVAGRQIPLKGELTVLGLTPDEDNILFRRNVSVVFDADAFFPALTVREHLLLVAHGHGVMSASDAVDAELAAFGLSGHADSAPQALSSGQKRKVLLAAGLIRPSRLLILDEPEQRLDPVTRDLVSARIRRYADEGGAVLLVTHDPEVLLANAGSCLLLGDETQTLTPDRAAAGIAGR